MEVADEPAESVITLQHGGLLNQDHGPPVFSLRSS